MKIGVFDSGLGGLVIARAITKKLPKYDYAYLGDTKRIPYGSKSQKQIYKYAKNALKFLFKENCELVIIACNTVSAKALRKIQREFLPKYFPSKKVLGVIVPTLEVVSKTAKKVGVIATKSTVNSHAYKKELFKIHPKMQVFEQSSPQLVSFIENNTLNLASSALNKYLKPLLSKKIDSLILGCTHYPIVKKQIQKKVGNSVKVYSQEEIIPDKLKSYLKKHKEIENQLSKNAHRDFFVTKLNTNYKKIGQSLFGKSINFKVVTF